MIEMRIIDNGPMCRPDSEDYVKEFFKYLGSCEDL